MAHRRARQTRWSGTSTGLVPPVRTSGLSGSPAIALGIAGALANGHAATTITSDAPKTQRNLFNRPAV